MKGCPTSPILRETQIKTTVRHYLTPITMAEIKQREREERARTNDKHWPECRETGILAHGWGEHEMMQLLWSTVASSSKKYTQNYRMAQQSHLWGYTQKNRKWDLEEVSARLCSWAALLGTAKAGKQPKCPPTDEEPGRKLWYIQRNLIQPLERRKFCRLLQHGWTLGILF